METGFVAPADHVLTDVYLGGKIAGRPVASSFIHHTDVYSALPEDLVSSRQCVRDRDGNDACFLYTPVRYAGKNGTGRTRKRGIDGDPRKSYWHSEGGKTPLEGSKKGGYVQDFTHAIKDTHRRTQRLGWRMKEYGLSTEHGDSHLVLCKVYRTPRKTSTTPATSATPAAVPAACDLTDISKKRKAADGDCPEGSTSTPSARRPRLTHEHPTTATTRDPEPESADEELFKMYCQVMDETERNIAAAPPSSFFQSIEQEFPSLYPVTEEALSPWAPAAQPEGDCFFHSIEQEFPSLYPNHNNVAMTEEATPPWAQAAQPEEHAATDYEMDASLSEEGALPESQPDEPAPDEVIYGLPCPAFSPEMIRRCSMTPWPSPSSMRTISGLY